ncbi:MAG: hypothetical protein PVF34_11675 [Gammaproteobacteria bacterium]|jgi:uncharacterized low-complexity protein
MKTRKNAISLAIGTTALFGSLTATSVISADSNPFGFTDLNNGYMIAGHDGAKGKDGSCGESKCGDNKAAKKVKKDGSCGESKCGDDKAKAKKVSKIKKDGSCGESKCGDNKK